MRVVAETQMCYSTAVFQPPRVVSLHGDLQFRCHDVGIAYGADLRRCTHTRSHRASMIHELANRQYIVCLARTIWSCLRPECKYVYVQNVDVRALAGRTRARAVMASTFVPDGGHAVRTLAGRL